MLLILCGGLHFSHCEKLNCQFKDGAFGYVGNVYYCSVTSFDNSLNSMTIDGFTGVLKANKNYHNINGIWIYDTNTKYIPEGLGFLFNLTALLVQNSNLIEIKAGNFLGMQNLEYLSLYDNKITSVPSDAFSTRTKLRYLSLAHNQIEVVPSNLFSNNMNLENIDLNNNQIKYIGSGVFDQLKKLKVVFLNYNICINKDFRDIIYNIKRELSTNVSVSEYVFYTKN